MNFSLQEQRKRLCLQKGQPKQQTAQKTQKPEHNTDIRSRQTVKLQTDGRAEILKILHNASAKS